MNLFRRLISRKPSTHNDGDTLTPAEVVTTLAKDYIGPALAPLGYGRDGHNFYKPQNELTLIINLQSSRYNSMGDCRFFVNVGVFHEGTYEIFWNRPLKSKPKEYDAQIRWRLQSICPYPVPDQWRYKAGEDIESFGTTVGEAIVAAVTTTLTRFNNLAGMYEYLKKQKKLSVSPVDNLMVAIVATQLKHQGEASKYLQASVKVANYPSPKRSALQIAKRLKLPLSVPELAGEQVISFRFAIQDSKPSKEELKVHKKLTLALFSIGLKELGYTDYEEQYVVPKAVTINFYTRQPDTVLAELTKVLARLPVQPGIKVQKARSTSP